MQKAILVLLMPFVFGMSEKPSINIPKVEEIESYNFYSTILSGNVSTEKENIIFLPLKLSLMILQIVRHIIIVLELPLLGILFSRLGTVLVLVQIV